MESNEKQALTLKTLAETTYTSSPTTNLNSALSYATKAHTLSPSLDGLTETLTAFQILSHATQPVKNWYRILQIEPFSQISVIKKQYRKLALTLHPDKNAFAACEEAFKYVSEAFGVLSDKGKRKAYDTDMRMAMQAEATEGGGVAERESFWTLCVACTLMHQFERKYLGFNLMCPGCNKSFKALEIDFDYGGNKDKGVGEVLERSMPVNDGLGTDDSGLLRSKQGVGTRGLGRCKFKRTEITEGIISLNNGESNSGIRELRSKRGVRTKGLGECRASMEDSEEEGITLAEVLERSMREKDNGSGLSTSKRGGSNLKKGEVEDEGFVLSEILKRSMPGNSKLRSKRGVGTRVTDESKKSKRVESQDDWTKLSEVLERSMPENGAVGCENGVFRSKGMQKGVVFDGKSVSMRNADESRSKRAGIEEEESRSAEVFERSIPANGTLGGNDSRVLRPNRGVRTSRFGEEEEEEIVEEVFERSIPANSTLGSNESRVLRPNRGVRTRRFGEEEEEEEEIVEEGITLAESIMRAKKKVREEKMRLRAKEKREEREKANNKKRRRVSADVDMEIMSVIDSDFYDFGKDRVAKNLKKGQVWAVYDGDDSIPRHYGLIDEVSLYPFKIRLIWLGLESSSNGVLLSWDRTGVHVSCGRFKVAETDIIHSVNIFSHSVTAERAAREVYRIYPKKGSVWALFNENASQNSDKRCYDIVVCLTSYDETYGLSMGYLEKVDGFKTVFKRREIGSHAVKWLEKPDFRLFSHQIPARKLLGEEASEISRDCWELDPASLPSELLSQLA